MPLFYKGEGLGVPFRVDMMVYGDVPVELKALPTMGRAERAQVAHYLKATGCETGLLLNFGSSSLQVERLSHLHLFGAGTGRPGEPALYAPSQQDQQAPAGPVCKP